MHFTFPRFGASAHLRGRNHWHFNNFNKKTDIYDQPTSVLAYDHQVPLGCFDRELVAASFIYPGDIARKWLDVREYCY